MSAGTEATQAGERAFFGHPRGLAVLFGTESFVAFAQYGVQSILVLALVAVLARPGGAEGVVGFPLIETVVGLGPHASPQAGAAMLAGLFGALIFSAPIFGGIVADRLLGHTRSVILGLVLLSAGLSLLIVPSLLLVGLAVMVIGMGLAGTLKAQLGELYARDDPRRSNGFQIYALAPSVAVLFAPIICGWLGQNRSWSLGFAATAIGGVAALSFYAALHHLLRSRLPTPPPAIASAPGVARAALTRRDWLVLAGLALLLPVFALNSIGNMEIFDGYLLWAKQHYDLRFFGHLMPVSWLLTADAFVSMGATVLSVALWSWLERRGRPVSDLSKILIGTLLAMSATLVLAAAPTGRVGLGWGIAFHVLNDLGFTNTYTVSLAFYSRLAPDALRATVTNAGALQIFLSNLVVARLASRLSDLGPTRFWLSHAALIGLSAIVLAAILIAVRLLTRRSRTAPAIEPAGPA